MIISHTSSLREPCGLSYGQLSRIPDEQIMVHLGAGHDDAIAVLFDRYSRLVLKIALGILHDKGEAEDVTQEIFIELCRTAGAFDAAKGSAKLWILRCAYRRSLNRKRHLNCRNFYAQEDISKVLDELSDSGRSVVPAISVLESRRLVRQMLTVLDRSQRQVLELAYFEGLSMAEISQKTGASTASVRHRYYRGLRKLRVLMHSQSETTEHVIAGETVDAGA